VVLRIASDCGLVINRAEVIRDALGNEGLLVTRFDRIRVRSSSRVRRIHQEDGCQILDRYPADKYRIRAQDIAEGIIEYASAPVIQILRFIEMYVFSYLIGNADMHAKNVSLYQSPPTNLIELTPAYDLVCTLIYKGIDPSMAMRLDGRDDSFHRKDFVRFGERYGLREKVTNAAINNLCDRFRPWLDRIDQLPVEGKRLDHISSVLRRRFADLIG
jgi:serine/threonine-protein kinase HipA